MKVFLQQLIQYYYKSRVYSYRENIRTFIKKSSLKSYGEGVIIDKYVIIKNGNNVTLGKNVCINSFIHIWGKGGVTIGDNVLIGSHTSIVSETHDYKKELMYHTHSMQPVIIENNVWIGTHCVIMPGVVIRSGSVIGAGSIVTKDTIQDGIYVGVPSRLIQNRFGLNP